MSFVNVNRGVHPVVFTIFLVTPGFGLGVLQMIDQGCAQATERACHIFYACNQHGPARVSVLEAARQ